MSRQRSNFCPRVTIVSPEERLAYAPCSDADGNPITMCSDAPSYNDYALPCSESLCQRVVDRHEVSSRDPYKLPYVKVCHNMDQVLSDDYRGGSAHNLHMRFDVMSRELEDMICDPELGQGDKGRYLYHIDARVLQAYLPLFEYRAEQGDIENAPAELIRLAYDKMCGVLEDFDTLYRDVAMQVALRRTEVEIFILQLRKMDPRNVPWPALFREESSASSRYNHDGYVLDQADKIPFQIKSSDYVTRGPAAGKNGSYAEPIVLVIHQSVVNLDYHDQETITTRAVRHPYIIADEDEIYQPEDDYTDSPRYIAWGAKPFLDSDEFDCEFVQRIGGRRRDSLTDSILKEWRGERLSADQMNLLNGATHYLSALINQRRK